MKNVWSILLQKNLVVRRTTRPQFLVDLTYFLVVKDARTLEFCYPEQISQIKVNIRTTAEISKESLAKLY